MKRAKEEQKKKRKEEKRRRKEEKKKRKKQNQTNGEGEGGEGGGGFLKSLEDKFHYAQGITNIRKQRRKVRMAAATEAEVHL